MKKGFILLLIILLPALVFGQKKRELKAENRRLKYDVEMLNKRLKIMVENDSIENVKNNTNLEKPNNIDPFQNSNTKSEKDCGEVTEGYEKEVAYWKGIVEKKMPKEFRYSEDIADQKDWFRNEVNNKLIISLNGRIAIRSEQIESFQTGFDIYVIEPIKNKENIALYLKDEKGENYSSLGKLNTSLNRNDKKLLFAMNAGMYAPSGMPQGLFIENRKEEVKIDLRTDEYGNFYMMPNGVFFIDTLGYPKVVNSTEFEGYRGQVQFATQSGPALVLKDVYNSHFNQWSDSRKVRNGVGVTRDNKLIFVISRSPINLYDFATFFNKILDCPNALYLDGVVSKVYCPELGRDRSQDIGGNFGPIIGITE